MRNPLLLASAISAQLVWSQVVELDGQALSFTVCYHDDMDSLVAYHDSGVESLFLRFCAGQMEACCDNVVVYDGPDDTAPVLYWGSGDAGDLTGVLVIATSPWITLQILSNDSVSCADQAYLPLEWVVYTQSLGTPDCIFTNVSEAHRPNMSISSTLASEYLLITWPGDLTLDRVDVYDASVRTIATYRNRISPMSIDVRGFAAGGYQVVATGRDGLRNATRFTVQRP